MLFHLLLPLCAIREQEKEDTLNEIVQRLQQIPLFREHSEYIGKCILYGLSIPDSDILDIPEIGIICLSNHSYRNALRYEDDKEDIKRTEYSFVKIVNMQLTSGLTSPDKGRLATEHYKLWI